MKTSSRMVSRHSLAAMAVTGSHTHGCARAAWSAWSAGSAITSVPSAGVLAALGDTPGGAGLVEWLEQHRAEVLEELAAAYTSSEAPLLDVAQRVLSERAPLPARLPAGWEDVLADWLSQTGLVGRRGTRLRFSHQTFAEHLAATAGARGLPEPFAPDHPRWDELVSGCLLDDEAAERLLLLYLHLRGPGGLLAWLQHGSEAQREAAARLVCQGAPCGDAELAALLDRVAGQTLTGRWTDSGLRSLAGLTRHAAVRSRLYALLRDAAVNPGAKIRIVDLLREQSTEARRVRRGAATHPRRGHRARAGTPRSRRGAGQARCRAPRERRRCAAPGRGRHHH
jgi:hypothetical protein